MRKSLSGVLAGVFVVSLIFAGACQPRHEKTAAAAGAFAVSVRDAYGAPVPYASLVARLPDGGHVLSSTGRDGRAAFRLPCPASACSLEVVQPAYLPYTGPLVPAVTLRGRCGSAA